MWLLLFLLQLSAALSHLPIGTDGPLYLRLQQPHLGMWLTRRTLKYIRRDGTAGVGCHHIHNRGGRGVVFKVFRNFLKKSKLSKFFAKFL